MNAFGQSLEFRTSQNQTMMTKQTLKTGLDKSEHEFLSWIPYTGKRRSQNWRNISIDLDSQKHEGSIINDTNRGCLKEKILESLSESVEPSVGPFLLFAGVGAAVNEKLIADIVCEKYKRCQIGILDASKDMAEFGRDEICKYIDNERNLLKSCDFKIFDTTFENFSLHGIQKLREEIGNQPIFFVSQNNPPLNRIDVILNERPYTEFSYPLVFANLCREQDLFLFGYHTLPKPKENEDIEKYREEIVKYMKDSYEDIKFRKWLIAPFARRYKMDPKKVRIEINALSEELEKGFIVEPKYDISPDKIIPLYVSGKLSVPRFRESLEKVDFDIKHEFQSENGWAGMTLARTKKPESIADYHQLEWFNNIIKEKYNEIKNNYQRKEQDLALIQAIKKTIYQIKNEEISIPNKNDQNKYIRELELIARNFGTIVSLPKEMRGFPCRYKTELNILTNSFGIEMKDD